MFLQAPRETLAARLWKSLASTGFISSASGGVPTFVAEIILVVVTLSAFQVIVRMLQRLLLVVKAITIAGDADAAESDEDTGKAKGALDARRKRAPLLPLSLLSFAVLGASLLDSASAFIVRHKTWAGWAMRARLGCDMMLEVALAAVALHLLDVLRGRVLSEEQAKLGQTIMSGGPSTRKDGVRPRVIDRKASINEARLNTLVQTLSAVVWVCTAFALLDTAGINYQALLTVGGVSSVLLGFIGRDILSNLMGATVLYLTQPFTQGDWIQSVAEASDGRREIDGWVEKIGWCALRLREGRGAFRSRAHRPSPTVSVAPCGQVLHGGEHLGQEAAAPAQLQGSHHGGGQRKPHDQ